MTPWSVVGYAWLVWFTSWLLAARWQARIAKRATTVSEIAYRLLVTTGGALLIGVPTRYTANRTAPWSVSIDVGWVLFVVVLGGFAVTWWARVHLGRMWSSGVSRKADHQVIATGPYGLVRHPIYSGLALSSLATAALRGTLGASIGAATLILGFYVKARLEERFLRAELGAAYGEYAQHVGRLIPFVGRAAR